MFNARAKSVADKPMFRDAFHWNRCITPASGYYEWTARPNGHSRITSALWTAGR
jgi:putative SOS response-associated peptidase YedK